MVMTCGMATIAGTVMVLYASILGNTVPDALGQILVASLVSVPAALVVAALMVPPTGTPTGGTLASPIQASGAMDAITQGTLKGLELLLAIVAMLIVLVALVSLVNLLLALFPEVWGSALTLQRMLGWVLSPAGLAHGHSVERSDHGRRPAGDQDRAERVDRLHRPCAPRRQRPLPAQPPHHDLRAVRLRQFRQPGHHDRRHGGDGAASAAARSFRSA